MKLVILVCFIFISYISCQRSSHPYEFVRADNSRRLGTDSNRQSTNYFGRSRVGQGNRLQSRKPSKKDGVPPYAVLMEPLVQYSQPDPLYNNDKHPASEAKTGQESTSNDLIKNTIVFDAKEKKDELPDIEIEESKQVEKKLIPDSEAQATHDEPYYQDNYHHHHHHEEPEPIIEIIIKESNESLPAPPPLPSPPKKKKKEPVQVFYVKYKSDPTSYGEEKVIYEAPVPAITPPTNNQDEHVEEEDHSPYPDHFVTQAPLPSTTLKAIIRPDSETFHGSGLHITFGETKDSSDHQGSYGHGEYEQQSAPQPSVLFPHRDRQQQPTSTPAPVLQTTQQPQLVGAHSVQQPIKRNPVPFQTNQQPPQQSLTQSKPTQLPHPQGFQQPPQYPPIPFRQPQPQQQQRQGGNRPPPGNFQQRQTYHTLPQPSPFPKQQPFNRPTGFQQPAFTPHHHHHHHPQQQPPHQHQPQQQQPQQQRPFIPPPQPAPSQQYHTINLPPRQSPPVNNQFLGFRQPAPAIPQYHTIKYPPPPVIQPQPQPQPQPHYPPFPPQSQIHNPYLSSPQLAQPNYQPVPQYRPFQNQPSQPPPPQQPPHQHQQVQPKPLHAQQQQQQPKPLHPQQQQQQHSHQIEQLNRLHQQQQRLEAQLSQLKQIQATPHTEIIKSVDQSEELRLNSYQQPFVTQRPQYTTPYNHPVYTSTSRPVTQTPRTLPPKRVIYTTTTTTTTRAPETTTEEEEPEIDEEVERRKQAKQKENEKALPDEVPDDLRQQLLSSGILGNADIQILDYDKIGDIPIENLPPEALANFQSVAGSAPIPAIATPDDDTIPSASETKNVAVARQSFDPMEMKIIRYNPESKEGASLADSYVRQDATRLDPVVLNDSKYNRYLPLKVSGAQFPVPDVPELRGRNVTSVVVLAPVDYEFLQRRDEDDADRISRSAEPALEVQGVHFVAGDILKALVRMPTAENYKTWLDRENQTAADKQSVVLLVLESQDPENASGKEIYMYDVSTQRVSKLKGELSSTFVEVAESNSSNKDLDDISDDPTAPGGDFTVNAAAPATSQQESQKMPRIVVTSGYRKNI